jgi:hypothetical protein
MNLPMLSLGGTWYYDKPAEILKCIRNKKYIRRKYGGTSIQFEYLTVVRSHAYDVENDFKVFILEKSLGLAEIGQQLFQQSFESFVCSILGAHAKTRRRIVGQGAKSLQTQEVFYKVFMDTVAQDGVAVPTCAKLLKTHMYS